MQTGHDTKHTIFISLHSPSQIRYSLWKEWKIVDYRNASWTINQQDEWRWEDLGRGGKTIDPEQA